MKAKVLSLFVLTAAIVSTLTLSALPRQNARKPAAKQVKLLGGILVPGNRLRWDIAWVDQSTARLYLGESGNAGVDVFDAENDLYLGRIGGFHGLPAPDDPCMGNQGMGPSGVVVTPNHQLWATDAHGTVKVFDVSTAEPPFDLVKPLATISTGAQCRADEIGFDPKDHVIVVGNPAEKPPYATVISSDPPYAVLGKIPFEGARGVEQPLWVPGLKGGRMLVTVPGLGGTGGVVVINLTNPSQPVVETTYPTPNCASGLVLGPSQHLMVGCGGGKPLIIINALDGKLITTVEGTHGGDELWYNAGDNRYYAATGNGSNPILSVVDAATGKFIDNLPAGPGVHSQAAYQGNNHVFVAIGPPTQASPKDTCNVMFGFPANQGCIAVYGPAK